jgi:hypothetical protein
MELQQAEQFAEAWVAAWNAHDLERILAHYEDDFEMSSPAIARLAGEPSGVLKGKQAVTEYWAAALKKYPELRFELLHVLRGTSSVTLVYEGVLGLSAEVFHFADSGKVAKAYAHYQR